MYDQLFRNQRALAPAVLPQHAQALGLDAAKFSACLEGGKFAGEIRRDMADAESASIQGTPYFIIGIVNPGNPRDPRIKVLKTISGAHPYPVFKAALDAALAAAGQK